jgi:hypothetical protein
MLYKFERGKLREVDKSLCYLLQVAFDLNLISSETHQHAATCDTNLLVPLEEV